MTDKLYTINELASLLGVSPKTIRNRLYQGRFERPLRTIFGLRYTTEQVDHIIQSAIIPEPVKPAPKRRRGRPSITKQRMQTKGANR